MKLSVIVPCFNEVKTVKGLLDELTAVPEVKQVIVVDYASTDGTDKILQRYRHQKVTVIRHKLNQGKGAAIQTGLTKVQGTHVLIQDADLEYDPREIKQLIVPIKEGRTKVVYGSRFLGPRTNMFFWHYVGNRWLNFLINILYNSILTDMETCYKVMPTEQLIALNLKQNDFRIEPEITCKLLLNRVRILEVPITFMARTYSEGKKITWKDGFKAIGTIVALRIGVKR